MEMTPSSSVSGSTLTLLSGFESKVTWQPGQALQACVLNVETPQQATLDIGGRVVRAQIDLPLKPGQVLDLVVVHGGPKPQLQIADHTQDGGALERALRLFMPRQQMLGDVVRSFFQLVGTGSGQRPLPSAVDVLVQAILTLPDLSSLTTATAVKQAIQQSGLFFEALAAQNLLHGENHSVLPDDLKHRLLRLSAQLNLAIEQGASDREQLDALLTRTEAALARLHTLQINHMMQQNNDASVWMIELPVSEGDHHGQLQFRIRRQVGREQDIWQVRISLDIESLGPLEAVVSVHSNTVNIYFTAEQQATVTRFEQDLELLRNDLQSHGLDTGQLKARQGKINELFDLHHVSLVDENV